MSELAADAQPHEALTVRIIELIAFKGTGKPRSVDEAGEAAPVDGIRREHALGTRPPASDVAIRRWQT